MISRGWEKRLRWTRPMKCRSICSVEIGDHAVAERSHRGDRRRRAADHPLRLLADRVHLAVASVDRDHRRLGDDDALSAHVDERVRGAEIDREIAATETGHEGSPHGGARP